MHTKFQIEIPKQIWVMLQKPHHLLMDGQMDRWTRRIQYTPTTNFVERGYNNASGKYPTFYHLVTEMCTQKCGDICTFLLQNGALPDMRLVHCGICTTGLLILVLTSWAADILCIFSLKFCSHHSNLHWFNTGSDTGLEPLETKPLIYLILTKISHFHAITMP